MAYGWRDLVRDGLRAITEAAKRPPVATSSGTTKARERATKTGGGTTKAGGATARPSGSSTAEATRTATGHVSLPDFDGRLTPVYAPDLDGDADPGEIVWTWVPYEDDPSQGKDRPVLVVGHDSPHLLGLMLTSKDHDRNAAKEARHGRYWMDIGSGDWDAKRRPSELRLDRVLRIDPDEVRREGAIMPRGLFDEVVASLTELKGW